MNNALASRTEGELAVRSQIDLLESLMVGAVEQGTMEQTLFDGVSDKGNDQCQHFFGDGVYARGVAIPAGTAVIGKIHKLARVCVIAKGTCTFVDEFHRMTVEAPWIGEFRGGTKTAVFAHTDTYWVACVGTDINDPQTALEELSAKTYEDYNAFVEEEIS